MGQMVFLTWSENRYPTSAKRTEFTKDFKSSHAKAEVFNEGVHLGRFACWVCRIAFPNDDISI
jgi:hypothetical protein